MVAMQEHQQKEEVKKEIVIAFNETQQEQPQQNSTNLQELKITLDESIKAEKEKIESLKQQVVETKKKTLTHIFVSAMVFCMALCVVGIATSIGVPLGLALRNKNNNSTGAF